MIDFVYKLGEVLPQWPSGSKPSLAQVSECTETSMPHVIQYLSEGLGKDIEVGTALTRDELGLAVKQLAKHIQPEIEERERQKAIRRQRAEAAYLRSDDKVRTMQLQNNWHGAFRTLSYFIGEHADDLSPTSLISLCSEAVRTGIKSGANMQELGQWLQRGVATAMSQHSRDGINDALDLVDAYGEHFLSDDSGKGPLQLGSILAALEEPAARYELWDEYKELVNQLYPEH